MSSEKIINILKENRPNITKSSIKTYESILRNLYNKIYDDENYDLDRFNIDSQIVLKFLNTMPFNKRKTILAALVVITDNKDYREQMLKDIKEYNKDQLKQTKSKKQEESWIDTNEIMDIYKALENKAKFLYKKPVRTILDDQEIQNYIIVSLLGGIFIPPRRSKDYVNFKLKNIDKTEDNYLDKNIMIFNNYKTAKTYGQQSITLPKELKTILLKWIKINPTDYLLYDGLFNPLTNVTLNQRLNKIFNKKVGVNQLRHTFLSEKYGGMINVKNELQEDFKAMGSSMHQEAIYIKN